MTIALCEPSTIDVSTDIERFAEMGLLSRLLKDRTTGRNIIWASNVFIDKGNSYAPSDEILPQDVTGKNAGLIRTRASKAREAQAALTKAHAEVFTPGWVVRKMVDEADGAWVASHPGATWEDYVASLRLEITCGEAPYLVNRYDAADGTPIPVEERCGILDRKLRLVGINTTSQQSWARWALVALRSTYGYEYQGDNLLIARVNALATMEEFAASEGYVLTPWSYRQFIHAISYNLWQMDGLADTVPEREITTAVSDPAMDVIPGLEDYIAPTGEMKQPADDGLGTKQARIYDWGRKNEVEFKTLKGEGTPMRFDYVIGNPPYQDETLGDNAGYAPQIYNMFMDGAYDVGSTVELITPARFLFNAGSTPRAWNKKMLEDEHLKVLWYEPDAAKVFPNTEIKGGVAITLRDDNKVFGAIGVFSKHAEMNGVRHKVDRASPESFASMVYSAYIFHLSDQLYVENDYLRRRMSRGHAYDLKSNVFDKLADVFPTNAPDDGHEYVMMLGRQRSERVHRYIRREYLRQVPNIDAYKIFIPKANGAGHFGEVLSQPVLLGPGTASTETFLSVGMLADEQTALRVLSYLKTKFCRAMLGILKVTQDLTPGKFQHVPLQDFSTESDIDWTQSIADIDQQLYAKYGLSDDEVDFIETHVKEMS